MKKHAAVVGLTGLLSAIIVSPALAKKDESKQFAMINEDVGLPVFPYDLTDRPYKVLGEVTAEVRKGTIFSKEASQEKIYHELWERAEKLDADAVINAQYGKARVTMMSWGSIKATGTAIKFLPSEKLPENDAATPVPIEAGAGETGDSVSEETVAPPASN